TSCVWHTSDKSNLKAQERSLLALQNSRLHYLICRVGVGALSRLSPCNARPTNRLKRSTSTWSPKRTSRVQGECKRWPVSTRTILATWTATGDSAAAKCSTRTLTRAPTARLAPWMRLQTSRCWLTWQPLTAAMSTSTTTTMNVAALDLAYPTYRACHSCAVTAACLFSRCRFPTTRWTATARASASGASSCTERWIYACTQCAEPRVAIPCTAQPAQLRATTRTVMTRRGTTAVSCLSASATTRPPALHVAETEQFEVARAAAEYLLFKVPQHCEEESKRKGEMERAV
ncbi:hypothetical protein F442_14248, partial [Phytophthora nicotianae P10297]